MLGFKIWGLAQGLNFIISLFVFQDAAIVFAIFAVVGGLPAILFFNVVLAFIGAYQLPYWLKLSIALIVFPIITAACVAGVFICFGEFSWGISLFAAIPCAATILSVLFAYKTIQQLSPNNDTDDTNS